MLQRFAALAKELGVVLPLSWYEKAGNAYFNSLSVADADGRFSVLVRPRGLPIPGTRYEVRLTATSGDQTAQERITLVQRQG